MGKGNKKKLVLHNIAHAMTDNVGSWDKQWLDIAYSGYAEGTNKVYFSPYEVEHMLKTDYYCENVYYKKDGKIGLKESYASAIELCRIVNGVIFKGKEPVFTSEQNPVIAYMFAECIASPLPKDIEMLCGVKSMKINYNKSNCDFQYKLKEEVLSKSNQYEIRRIISGYIKHEKSIRKTYSTGGKEKYIETLFDCTDMYYDAKEGILHIKGVDFKYVDSRIGCDLVKELDMMLKLVTIEKVTDLDIDRIVEIAKISVRDSGQYHWLNEDESKNERKSNNYWYKYSCPHYWCPSDRHKVEKRVSKEFISKFLNEKNSMIDVQVANNEDMKDAVDIKLSFDRCNVNKYYTPYLAHRAEGAVNRYLWEKKLLVYSMYANERPYELFLERVPTYESNIIILKELIDELDFYFWGVYSGEICFSHLYETVVRMKKYIEYGGIR